MQKISFHLYVQHQLVRQDSDARAKTALLLSGSQSLIKYEPSIKDETYEKNVISQFLLAKVIHLKVVH